MPCEGHSGHSGGKPVANAIIVFAEQWGSELIVVGASAITGYVKCCSAASRAHYSKAARFRCCLRISGATGSRLRRNKLALKWKSSFTYASRLYLIPPKGTCPRQGGGSR